MIDVFCYKSNYIVSKPDKHLLQNIYLGCNWDLIDIGKAGAEGL